MSSRHTIPQCQIGVQLGGFGWVVVEAEEVHEWTIPLWRPIVNSLAAASLSRPRRRQLVEAKPSRNRLLEHIGWRDLGSLRLDESQRLGVAHARISTQIGDDDGSRSADASAAVDENAATTYVSRDELSCVAEVEIEVAIVLVC